MIDQIKQLNILDYLVVVLYMAMLSGVGIYLAKFNKTVDDFFKGGGKTPWWIAGLSTFVSGFTAFMFVAAAGHTYKNGLSAVLLFTSAFWGYWLGYFVYAKKWRRARLSSPMEFLTKRYSQNTTYYYTLLSIIPAILGMGLGIYTLCIFLTSALGIIGWQINLGLVTLSGLELTMIVTGVVLLIYNSAGGLWGVMITDVMQFLVIVIMTLMIFPLAFLALGNGEGFVSGMQRLWSEAPDGYLNLQDLFNRPWFYLAYLTNIFIGYNAAWFIGQRYDSVPTERDARKMAILCSVLSLLLPLLWITPTMAARLMFPSISEIWPQLAEPAEASFVTLALTLLPSGMIGVTMSALLAATTSSVDTGLNYLASIIVRDIYVRLKETFSKRTPSEKQQLRVGRYTVLILGVLAIASALIVQRAKGVFEFALLYYSWFTPSMFTPVMLGFVYTKTPSWSAMASATTGLLLVLACNVVFDFSAHQYEANVFVGVLSSAAVFFLSAFWQDRDPKARARIAAFAQELATPATASEKTWDFNAMNSYKVVGVLTAGVGVVLILLMLVPASSAAYWLNAVAGFGTLAVGLMMVWYFWKKTREAFKRK
jgi:Na+/proline symporter